MGLLKTFTDITRNRFLRSVAYVGGGAAAAQLITVAFAPIITRLYGPEAFGVLALFTSLVAILTPVTSLAYVHAIALPSDDEDAIALLGLSFWIALTFGVIVFGEIGRDSCMGI